jgi:hypothetical protein
MLMQIPGLLQEYVIVSKCDDCYPGREIRRFLQDYKESVRLFERTGPFWNDLGSIASKGTSILRMRDCVIGGQD